MRKSVRKLFFQILRAKQGSSFVDGPVKGIAQHAHIAPSRFRSAVKLCPHFPDLCQFCDNAAPGRNPNNKGFFFHQGGCFRRQAAATPLLPSDFIVQNRRFDAIQF
ncbi:MAG: hypothetical protein R2941_03770 [Desulfobacterales bacterium]